MNRLLLALALLTFAGCGSDKPPSEADDYMESMKWWGPAYEWEKEMLNPVKYPEDGSPRDEELIDAMKRAMGEKDRIWREQSLSKSCKWYYDRIYKKSPEEIKRLCREEKWSQF